MSSEGLAESLLVASRVIWYIGALGVIGACSFRLFVLDDESDRTQHLRTTRFGLLAALVLLLGAGARLYAQAYVSFGLDEPLTTALLVATALELPPWSTGWQLQAAAALFTLAAFAWSAVGSAGTRMIVTAAAVSVALSAPLTGHAVSQPGSPIAPVVLQAAHVAGAGAWLGTLLVLLVVGIRDRDPLPDHAEMVAAFSRVALGGAAVLFTSGALTTLLYLETVSQVWTTAYGRVLGAKVLLAAAGVAAVGFVNWRYVRPRLSAPGGSRMLRRMVIVELTLALVTLTLTALLVGMPQPGGVKGNSQAHRQATGAPAGPTRAVEARSGGMGGAHPSPADISPSRPHRRPQAG
jgi:copper transport protein